MKPMKLFKPFGILLTLLFFFFLATPSLAIEYFFLGGRPANPDSKIPNSSAWFIYSLNPGEQKEDALEAINNYEQPTELLIYAADGIKSSSGGFALKQYVEPRTDVGSWVRFYPYDVPKPFEKLFKANGNSILRFCEQELDNSWDSDEKKAFQEWCEGEETVQIKISAKSKRNVDFVFSVPDNASVGEHTGGILIQKVEKDESPDKQGISLTTRVGIRIYQTVPGDIQKKLAISNFSLKKLYEELDFSKLFKKDTKPEEFLITTELRNEGNVSIDFMETIIINDDLFNKSEERVSDRKFQILRDDNFTSNYSWYSPRFGKFSISNNISYTDENNQPKLLSSNKITVWIIPWREMIVAGGILLLILIPSILLRAAQKKKYGGIGWKEYTIQVGDTLDSITSKFDVNWKLFVKTNKIEPPYTLTPGKKVLVPPLK